MFRKKIEYGDKHLFQIYYARIPNILGIESKPFDPDTYEEEDESKLPEGDTDKKIINPATVIRWRKAEDGSVSDTMFK